MKKNLIFTALLFLLISCSGDNTSVQGTLSPIRTKALNAVQKPVNLVSTNPMDEDYLSAIRRFSSDFASVAFSKSSSIFSPISLFHCFGMLYEGVENETRKQIGEVFHYEDVASLKDSVKKATETASLHYEHSELDVSSSFWMDDQYRERILKNYIQTLTDYYYAEVYEGALESDEVRQDLANWLNNKTYDMFQVTKDAFPTSSSTVLVLLNSIYLKSRWFNAFEEFLNKEQDFTDLEENKKKLTFMNATEIGNIYFGEDYQMAMLSLEGNIQFRMLLPNELSSSEEVFQDHILDILDPSNLPSKRYSIEYSVPQMKVKSKYSLTEVLPELGLTAPFVPSDDYGNILTKGEYPFYVSNAVHEAGMELNNDGIEAAAYTEIIMDECTSVGPENPLETFRFILDRPFLYTITYQGLPLFLGTFLG